MGFFLSLATGLGFLSAQEVVEQPFAAAALIREDMLAVGTPRDRSEMGRVAVVDPRNRYVIWQSPPRRSRMLGFSVAGPVDIDGDAAPDFLALALDEPGEHGALPQVGRSGRGSAAFLLMGYASAGELAWEEAPILRVHVPVTVPRLELSRGSTRSALVVSQEVMEVSITGSGGLSSAYSHPNVAMDWRLFGVGWNGAVEERLLLGMSRPDLHAVLLEQPLRRVHSGVYFSQVFLPEGTYIGEVVPGFLDREKKQPGMFVGRPKRWRGGGEVVFMQYQPGKEIQLEVLAARSSAFFGCALDVHEGMQERVMAIGGEGEVTIAHLDAVGKVDSMDSVPLGNSYPVEVVMAGDLDGDDHVDVLVYTSGEGPVVPRPTEPRPGIHAGLYSTGKQDWMWSVKER